MHNSHTRTTQTHALALAYATAGSATPLTKVRARHAQFNQHLNPGAEFASVDDLAVS